MKKKRLPAIAIAAAVMMSGCSGGSSDSSEPAAEDIITEYTAEPQQTDGGNAPAGIINSGGAAESTVPEVTAETVSSGVSLTKDEFAYLRDMIDYDGEFVTLDELGYEYYTVPAFIESDDYSIGFFSADNELLYYTYKEYLNSSQPDTGAFVYNEPIGDYEATDSLWEYNVITGEFTEVGGLKGCVKVMYADRDYVIYRTENYEYYVLVRETGEVLSISKGGLMIDEFFRCGTSILYNTYEKFFSDDGSISATIPVINRFYPNQNNGQKYAVGVSILGSAGYDLVCGTGGEVFLADSYLPAAEPYMIEVPCDDLYFGGEYVGYITESDRDDIFGQSSVVGYLSVSSNGGTTKNKLYKTRYGANACDIKVTAGLAAASCFSSVLNSSYGDIALLMDTNGGKAAVVTEGGATIQCSGDWFYFLNDNDNTITAVNTQRAG